MSKDELYEKARKEEVYKTERWIYSPENHFRFVGKYQDILSSGRHTGWYMDPFCSDVSYGVVYQLTGKKGQTRYLAGCSDGYDNESYSKINVKDIFDEKEDAAREADEMARIHAESSFENYVQAHAEDVIYEKKQEIAELKKIIKEICLELRNIKPTLLVSKQMRFEEKYKEIPQIIIHAVISDIKNKVKEIQNLRKEIRKYENDPSWCWN